MRTRMQLVLAIAASVLLIATSIARALQEGNIAWDPVSCWDCTTTADYVGPVIWGYLIGAFVGFSGILRRRYRKLEPATTHILDIS